jgi:hypothetical protein
MGFLQRSAVNVAVIMPLLGIAGCISYVVSKQLVSSEASLESLPPVTKAMPPTAKAVAVIDAERVRQPNEIAGEAFERALLLRDAMAGPVPEATFPIPLPKPRPRNLGRSSGPRKPSPARA